MSQAEDLVKRGGELYDKGDAAGALAVLQQATAQNPRLENAWARIGLILCELGRPAAAIAVLEKEIALNPSREVGCRRRIAQCEIVLGKPQSCPEIEKIQEAFDAAIEARDRRDFKAALEGFSRALELAPGMAALHARRGEARENLSDIEGALADAARALELRPDFAFVWFRKGSLLLNLRNNPEAALEPFTRAMDLSPDWPDPAVFRAYALARLERHAEALVILDAVLAKWPDIALAWQNRGNSHDVLNHDAEALRDFRRAGELDPVRRGKLAQVVARLEKAIAPPPPVVPASPPPVAAAEIPAAAPVAKPEAVFQKPVATLPRRAALLFAIFALAIADWFVFPLRGVEVLQRAGWMLVHRDDSPVFPPRCNLCMAVGCLRVDTEKKYVGGHTGYTSEFSYSYCPVHSPPGIATGTRFDDLPWAIYWIFAFLVSGAIVIPAAGLALRILAWPILVPLVMSGRQRAEVLLPHPFGAIAAEELSVSPLDRRINEATLWLSLLLLVVVWGAFGYW